MEGIFGGALSGWMSKSVMESPSDSVFVENNSAKLSTSRQKLSKSTKVAGWLAFFKEEIKRVGRNYYLCTIKLWQD